MRSKSAKRMREWIIEFIKIIGFIKVIEFIVKDEHVHGNGGETKNSPVKNSKIEA